MFQCSRNLPEDGGSEKQKAMYQSAMLCHADFEKFGFVIPACVGMTGCYEWPVEVEDCVSEQ